jgi:hypothetical protein
MSHFPQTASRTANFLVASSCDHYGLAMPYLAIISTRLMLEVALADVELVLALDDDVLASASARLYIEERALAQRAFTRRHYVVSG